MFNTFSQVLDMTLEKMLLEKITKEHIRLKLLNTKADYEFDDQEFLGRLDKGYKDKNDAIVTILYWIFLIFIFQHR